ncbi:MAG TPA: LacI family DNA-binding transcriptional regulator [Baekduia sp.]|nr:LacI family DNA-binding transcriptional regulator [Baekduia sp.]
MAITSRDIAKAAGVSQSTVSRALRGDTRVAEETRLRVVEAAERLRYTPNLLARSLITNRTKTIGVVVSDITNPFYPELLDVLHAEINLSGYRTVLFNERTDEGNTDTLLPQLAGRAVDGMVFASATLGSRSAEIFSRAGLPVVLLNRRVDEAQVDLVISDNYNGGQLAGRFLADLGHRRIALIAGPANTSTSRDREAGFREALEARGAQLDERLRRAGDYSHQSGYQWCIDLMRLDPPPTAIFCANDVVAFGALDAAKRLGVRVPEDLSILGFDDIEMASWEVFSVTTIRQPLARMAKLAVRMLIERLEGQAEPEPRAVVFPTQLVRRETTAPPAQEGGTP